MDNLVEHPNLIIVEAAAQVSFVPGGSATSFSRAAVQPFFEKLPGFKIEDWKFQSGRGLEEDNEDEPFEFVRAYSRRESAHVLLHRNSFSYHIVPVFGVQGYQGYESLKERFYGLFNEYYRIIHPGKIFRLGLCYRNRIIPNTLTIDLDDYFNLYPGGEIVNSRELHAFNVDVLFNEGDDNDTLKVSFRSEHLAVPGSVSLLMVFDVHSTFKHQEYSETNSFFVTTLDRLHNHVSKLANQTFSQKLLRLPAGGI